MRYRAIAGVGFPLLVVLFVAAWSGCTPKPPEGLSFISAASTSPFWRSPWDALAGAPDLDSAPESPVERTVVEPDIYRRVGKFLYVLNQYRGLMLVDLDTFRLIAQVPTVGFPRDLYIVGDRAYVLTAYAVNIDAGTDVVSFDLNTRLFVVDIADPRQPRLVNSFDIQGDLVDSRLVGDVLYIVGAEYRWDVLPGQEEPGGSSDGGVPVVNKQAGPVTWVTSINVADPGNIHKVDELDFPQAGTVIHATDQALFVAAPNWAQGGTTITYVDISDESGLMHQRGGADVPGIVADRYKMDVYEGVLRVVSAPSWPNRTVFVSTFDLSNPDQMPLLGRTEIPDAQNETLFATRFDGPRAYVVTYFLVDPLFVVDLSDPRAPKLAGKLEVPGWSTHIEPRGDRLLALGVDDQQGRRVVSVSLYDVADPTNPQQLARATFGENWSWSNAYTDVKAFAVFDDIIVVPFSGWTEQGGYERFQFLSYTHDNLEARGYVDVRGAGIRSFAYSEHYYGITSEELVKMDAADVDHPVIVARLPLAEYVSDYFPLGDGESIQVLLHFNEGETVIRSVAADGASILGEIRLDLSALSNSFFAQGHVVLVATGWDEQGGFYRVLDVDCSDRSQLKLLADDIVRVTPFWGWVPWYGGPEILTAMREDTPAQAEAKRVMPGYGWFPVMTENAFLVGNVIALRCTAETYDVVVGGGTPSEGLAVYDLAAHTLKYTLGIGFPWVNTVKASGAYLYISTQDNYMTDAVGRGYVAHFLIRLEPASGAFTPPVNVPGIFLQYDPAAQVLTLEDHQYGAPMYTVDRVIRTVRWSGDNTVVPLSAMKLPQNSGVILPRGTFLYYSGWESNAYVAGLRVGTDGALTAGPRLDLAGGWADLSDAQGTDVFLVQNGQAVSHYDFSTQPPTHVETAAVMSPPLRFRFTDTDAYGILGYSGVLHMAL